MCFFLASSKDRRDSYGGKVRASTSDLVAREQRDDCDYGCCGCDSDSDCDGVCNKSRRTKDANGFAVIGSLVMQQANVVSMREYVRIRLDNLV